MWMGARTLAALCPLPKPLGFAVAGQPRRLSPHEPCSGPGEFVARSALLRRQMSTPLRLVFYVAVKPERLREGLVSPESNRVIFMGADFEADVRPGGSMKWDWAGARWQARYGGEGRDPAVGTAQVSSVHFSTGAKSFQISSDGGTSARDGSDQTHDHPR